MSCKVTDKNRYSLQGARGRGLVSKRKEEALMWSGAGDGNPGGKRKAQEEGQEVWESGGKGKPPRKKCNP